jgi:hypothetical protein
MGKYLITMVMKETYTLEVDAETEDKAFEFSREIDLAEWNETGSITIDETIEEVTNG